MKKNTALALLTTTRSTRARRSGFFVKKKNKIKKNKIDGLHNVNDTLFITTPVCVETQYCAVIGASLLHTTYQSPETLH